MDTVDRLVTSMRELLWERGYVATSPKAIQQRAGAGQGSMYHHFTGKADLARIAIHRSAEDLLTLADEQFAEPGTAVQRIEAYLRRERDVLRGCPIGGLSQDPEVIEDPSLREPIAATLEGMRQRIAAVVAEGQAAGEFRTALNPHEVAAAMVAVLQGGYVLARAAASVEPFHQAVGGALALLRAASA
jgi:TetR/AcrR family transcriptional repressor of nem operon